MFSTKYYDSETKMYYYGFRYYFSALGRWINRDPLEEDDFSNLYCYVGNNPVCASDFLGNKTLIDYLEERMLYLYNNHSGQMGSKFPIPLPWCTKTDCITYCYTVIEWAYREIGRKTLLNRYIENEQKELTWQNIYSASDGKLFIGIRTSETHLMVIMSIHIHIRLRRKKRLTMGLKFRIM